MRAASRSTAAPSSAPISPTAELKPPAPQSVIDEKEAEQAAKKLQKGQFNFEDFLGQMNMIRKLGPLKKVLGMLPGVGPLVTGMLSDLLTPVYGAQALRLALVAVICLMVLTALLFAAAVAPYRQRLRTQAA